MHSTDDSFSTAPIMVVGEKTEYVATLKTLFVAAGILSQVIDFASGGEAASFLNQLVVGDRDRFPQLLFVDLQMPKLLGISFLWWLRSDRLFDSLPLITMSSSKQAKDIALERRLGSEYYLYKYPTASKLRRVCSHAVARRH